ncbi:MAG TPA: excisionase family DNA-binding protein [Candidatus Dormibacteraeota bacterium]|nr:excisionase family DNA-binding protein [Candidatus Dormibacteraeota bacterium]
MIHLLTIEAAAEQLCIGRRTMEKIVSSGELRLVRIGRAVRIDPADLETWLLAKKTRGGYTAAAPGGVARLGRQLRGVEQWSLPDGASTARARATSSGQVSGSPKSDSAPASASPRPGRPPRRRAGSSLRRSPGPVSPAPKSAA